MLTCNFVNTWDGTKDVDATYAVFPHTARLVYQLRVENVAFVSTAPFDAIRYEPRIRESVSKSCGMAQ